MGITAQLAKDLFKMDNQREIIRGSTIEFKCEVMPAPQQPSRLAGSSTNLRVQRSLKPSKLYLEANPSEFIVWKKAFGEHLALSNM